MKLDVEKEITKEAADGATNAAREFCKLLKTAGFQHIALYYDDGNDNGRHLIHGDPIDIMRGACTLLSDGLCSTLELYADDFEAYQEIISTIKIVLKATLAEAQMKIPCTAVWKSESLKGNVAEVFSKNRNSKQGKALIELLKSIIDEDSN